MPSLQTRALHTGRHWRLRPVHIGGNSLQMSGEIAETSLLLQPALLMPYTEKPFRYHSIFKTISRVNLGQNQGQGQSQHQAKVIVNTPS